MAGYGRKNSSNCRLKTAHGISHKLTLLRSEWRNSYLNKIDRDTFFPALFKGEVRGKQTNKKYKPHLFWKGLMLFFHLLAMWSSRNMKWGVMLYQINGPYTGAKYFLLVENRCIWHQQSFFVCCFTILPCNIFNNLFLEKKNKISLISFMQWTCIKFMNFLMKPHRSTVIRNAHTFNI